MAESDLPPSFARNVSDAFAEGRQWLDRLPELIVTCSQKWNLTLAGDPFDLSFNYVVPVLHTGKFAAVLKLGVPNAELTSEARALRTFDGHGAVSLLASDESLGALLLERIAPGNTLATLQDEAQASEIAAQTMLKLWKTPIGEAEFRSLENWTGGLKKLRAHFSGATGPFDARLVDIAENLREEILQGEQPSVLLHADLHHSNILYGTQAGWVAIDPKGVVGDPAYEPASFLLNPSPAVFLDRGTQQARIAILAEQLNMDRQRIVKWAFFHAVLSSWWTMEDGGQDWDDSMSAARVLLSLIR